MLPSIRKIIYPRPKICFELLESHAENTAKMTGIFMVMAQDNLLENRINNFKEMERLEQLNDDLTHKVSYELSKIFITPISREDIHDLAGVLDDVADTLYGAARTMLSLRDDILENNMVLVAQNIQLSVQEFFPIIRSLKNREKWDLEQSVEALKSLYNKAKDLYDDALNELYQNESGFKRFIKKREIYILLLEAAGKCKAVANAADAFLFKNIL